jgi:hypothetical protein
MMNAESYITLPLLHGFGAGDKDGVFFLFSKRLSKW